MKNILLYLSLAGLLAASCKHSDMQPKPAQSIAGTYQAKTYDAYSSFGNTISYPISGQGLTLKINYVSADTVSVEITPSAANTTLPNGVYSPSQTLSYPKAYVESPTGTATYIYLSGKPGDPVSTTSAQIWLYSDKQTADYLFTPQQTPKFPMAIRFQKN